MRLTIYSDAISKYTNILEDDKTTNRYNEGRHEQEKECSDRSGLLVWRQRIDTDGRERWTEEHK